MEPDADDPETLMLAMLRAAEEQDEQSLDALSQMPSGGGADTPPEKLAD